MKILCVFTLFVALAHSAKILVIFPLASRSHYILGSTLARALCEHGHDVTMISAFGEKTPPKGKYRDIVTSEVRAMMESRQKDKTYNMFEMGDRGPFINIGFLAVMMSEISELVLQDKGVQKLIHSGEKFDLVIIEQFYNDAHKVLASHFDAHQIVFSSIGPNFWINPLVASPSPLAYVPDILTSYSPEMTFKQRLVNTLVYLTNVATHHLYLYPKHDRVSKSLVPNAVPATDAIYNASLVLLNSHVSLNQAVPKVPNMIEIGGFHIKPPKKLPDDLQKFLDEAKDGVVYFSMGSNLKSADMATDKRDALLRVFSKLKQKVLWKWEEDVLPGQPANVKLGKWLPQQDILNHPNVKLFMTHGGLLSTTETIYFGVPILAIPIFGDQRMNAQNAVNRGFGLTLPYLDLTEEALTAKLHELLTNPKYGNNAKTQSKIFHDRQVKPLDTAMYWVDYVLRHNGAPHLRVAGLDLAWYQYYLLDVIAVIASVSLVSLLIGLFVLKKICQRLCSKKKDQKLKKQ